MPFVGPFRYICATLLVVTVVLLGLYLKIIPWHEHVFPIGFIAILVLSYSFRWLGGRR